MLIECPSCHTRAKLPDSKEGAKVRCPQCSFVYVARAGGGAAGRPRSRSSSVPIAVGTGIVVLVIMLVFLLKDEPEAPLPVVVETAAPAAPPRDSTGWNSEPVQLVRQIHDDAFGKREFELGRNLDVARIWAVARAREAGTDGDAGADTGAGAADPSAPAARPMAPPSRSCPPTNAPPTNSTSWPPCRRTAART